MITSNNYVSYPLGLSIQFFCSSSSLPSFKLALYIFISKVPLFIYAAPPFECTCHADNNLYRYSKHERCNYDCVEKQIVCHRLSKEECAEHSENFVTYLSLCFDPNRVLISDNDKLSD